jgi:hypothetical protein
VTGRLRRRFKTGPVLPQNRGRQYFLTLQIPGNIDDADSLAATQ